MNQPEKPYWLKRDGITFRQWKQEKRKRLRVLKEALDAYRLGCAYCPGETRPVEVIAAEIDQMIEAHSVKNWGR